MYWGYTESLLVWLLYSFISNMVTYQDILDVTKQVPMLIQRLGVLLVSCRVTDAPEIPFSISLSFWQSGSRRQFWQILDGSLFVANIAKIFGAFESSTLKKQVPFTRGSGNDISQALCPEAKDCSFCWWYPSHLPGSCLKNRFCWLMLP